MEGSFYTFIKPYLDFIDNGHLFRQPFSWLYTLISMFNLAIPIFILFKAIDNNLFDLNNKIVFGFLLVWLIIAFACWISFQLWWDRKNKVTITSEEKDDFVATPVFAHLIQTSGEWVGTWIGIVGFSIALLTTLVFEDESSYLTRIIGLDFIETGIFFIISMPILGFLIIVGTRFLAEQFRALSSIANNTKKR